MPKVSIIVPVYNVEKYIGRCIESIQKQTLTDWELILVDDCSPDNSMKIVEEYARRDNRIKIIYSEKNEGPMIARQKGVVSAIGEYISFTDSDDELPLNALEKLYNEAVKDNYDIVAGTTKYIKKSGDKLWECKLDYGHDYNGIITALLKRKYRHNLCAKLFKTTVLKDNEFYFNSGMKYFEDYLLLYQIVEKCQLFSVVNNVVYHYYQNEGSSTQKEVNPKRIEDAYIAYSYVCNRLVQNPVFVKMAKSYVQTAIKNQYVFGYNKSGIIDQMIHKYGFETWVTYIEILKNNNFIDAIKIIVGISRLGQFIYRMKANNN